ncbi:unnamed protein product, partial [Meganyctiphanes norvegica]
MVDHSPSASLEMNLDACENFVVKYSSVHLSTTYMYSQADSEDTPLGPINISFRELWYDADYLDNMNNRRSSLGSESLLEHDITEDQTLEGYWGSTDHGLDYSVLLGYEYQNDIYEIKKDLEKPYHPINCMASQPVVTSFMRCTLVNWLVKVNHELKFAPETAFLAVNLCDRFLQATPLAQDCLQLMATSALTVAAKMEECIVPGISELVAMCGGTYQPHHFRRMEVLMLSKLGFELYAPTTWFFITHLAMKAAESGSWDKRVVSLARYVSETCLCNYEVTQFLPSVQAAAGLLAATQLQRNQGINTTEFHNNVVKVIRSLYTVAEQEEATKCCNMMVVYMTPFLESLSPETGQVFFDPCTPPPLGILTPP